MNLKELLDRGFISIVEKDEEQAKKSLALAERDVKTSKELFNLDNFDWAFSVAYNAMLQSGRALMFSRGFRASGQSQHISVIEFLKSELNAPEELLIKFSKMRQKRHEAVYWTPETIGEQEAKSAIDSAEQILNNIKNSM